MRQFILALLLALVSATAAAEFTCPVATSPACIDPGDTVCPADSRCVGTGATCFEDYPCQPGEGFVCASSYDEALAGAQATSAQYDSLVTENVALREERLQKRNCVINAQSLKAAIACVR